MKIELKFHYIYISMYLHSYFLLQMLFLVLLTIGAATAAPVQNLYDPAPPGSYIVVEPVPEAPAFPPLQFGIANEVKKGFEDAVPAARSAPEEDHANNADDGANDAKPEASEHHEEQSQPEKPVSPDVIHVPPPPQLDVRPVVIRADSAPSLISWLPFSVPALQLPSLSSLGLPSLPSLPSLSWSSLPSLSSLPGLSNLNLPSISNLNLSNLSNFNIPGLSSIFGSAPKRARYIVYPSYY